MRLKKYLRFVSEKPCIICGAEAEVAHIRMSDAKYNKVNGRKDQWVIPLCPGHHRLYPDAQHNSGERIWWDRQGIDPLEISLKLWNEFNDIHNR